MLRVLRKWKRGMYMRREEILVLANGLYEQTLFAQTYFDFIKQYHKFSQSSQYLPEMNFSPCFYQISYSAWVRALHMELAKMYEDDDNHNTIKKLLGELKNINPEQDFRGSALERFKEDQTVYFPISPTDIKLFSPACRQQYIMLGDTASKTIATQISYQECVPFFTKKFRSISRHRESLRENRNQFYAHNSAEIQFDIEKINKNHQMKFENIQALIDYAMQITRFTIGVLTDVSKPTKYAKWYDWEATLILARDGYNSSRQEN